MCVKTEENKNVNKIGKPNAAVKKMDATSVCAQCGYKILKGTPAHSYTPKKQKIFFHPKCWVKFLKNKLQ